MPGVRYAVSVPWSDAERAQLRRMWQNGMGPVLIGRMLGRSKYAVGKQAKTLRLPKMRPANGERPPEAPPLPPRQPRAKPLRPGARTLPPLPSELHHD